MELKSQNREEFLNTSASGSHRKNTSQGWCFFYCFQGLIGTGLERSARFGVEGHFRMSVIRPSSRFICYHESMKLRPDLFFITGMSGSGKTTVGRRLTELGEVALDSKIQPGLFHFSDKFGNQPIDYQPNDAEWMAKFRWIMDKPMFDDLVSNNKNARRIFLCGGSDDIKQYWPLGQKVFMLEIDAKTMIQRLNSEERDNNFGKDKHTQLKLVERIERFQGNQIDDGAIAINAMRSIDVVVEDILSQAS